MDEMTLVEKNSQELRHYGTLGMKWGVRRYQNADGSLTAAGKKRYGTKTNFERVQAAKRAAAKANSKEAIAKRKADARTAAEVAKYRKKAGLKDTDKESDDDVNSATNSVKKSDGNDSGTQKKSSVALAQKKVKDLSDEELREVTARWRAEKDYLQVQKEMADVMKKPMTDAEKRKKDAEKAVTDVLTNALKNVGGQTATYMMGTAVNKLFADMFNDPQIINPKKGQKDK